MLCGGDGGGEAAALVVVGGEEVLVELLVLLLLRCVRRTSRYPVPTARESTESFNAVKNVCAINGVYLPDGLVSCPSIANLV